MDFDLGPDAAALRQRLRALIARELPADFLGAFTGDPEDVDTTVRFCQAMAAEHLLALAWPTEFGGGGSSVWEQTVVREEMWAHHEPRGPQYMAVNWIGPAIMHFGTEQQQAFHLPKMAAGEVIWCQGFSEPDAGSDLASLRTRAVADGPGWRVSGQKIWTSYAPIADFCVLAARTGPPESRRDGISVFLLPMDRPGVEVRPIDSMLGPLHLNEVFLDDVEVRREELLGPEHKGWDVIRAALAFERVGIARYARADRLLHEVHQHLGGLGDLAPGLRARYARALAHNRMVRVMAYDAVGALAEGEEDPGRAAAARVATVLGDQQVSDVLVEAIGPGVFDSRPTGSTLLNAAVEDYWRYSQAATVASGSLDIQRGLVARSALGPSA